jgi:hypothetical protein
MPRAVCSALTACEVKASAPMPYTVSVGSTTSSPLLTASMAAVTPRSRSATVRQS